MNTGIAENPVKIVIDTNIIISAIGFGGKPREILQLVLEKKVQAITTPVLLAELGDVVEKKFPKLSNDFEKIFRQIRKKFLIVKPQMSIHILEDEPDNRVLEAAVKGKCTYIVTGDKELLNLGVFRKIKIVKANQFLSERKNL